MKHKTLKILTVILAVCLLGTSIALAWVAVTRTITSTITVTATGDIRLYSDAGATTELTSYSLNIAATQAKGSAFTKDIYIKNLGNVLCYLRWTGVMTSGSGTWTPAVSGYNYAISGTITWATRMFQTDGTTGYVPKDGPGGPTVISLDVGVIYHAIFKISVERDPPQLTSWSMGFDIKFEAAEA